MCRILSAFVLLFALAATATVERDIHPVDLSPDEKAVLVAFLRALSSSR